MSTRRRSTRTGQLRTSSSTRQTASSSCLKAGFPRSTSHCSCERLARPSRVFTEGGAPVTTDFFIPRSVDEALRLLREHGADMTVMGGGTIVMGQINDGLLFPRKAMSLRRAGMDEVRVEDGRLAIGAATTLAR